MGKSLNSDRMGKIFRLLFPGKWSPCLCLLWSLSVAGYACKKVINVDLNNAAPQLVIEGEITDGPGPAQVRLSRSVTFSSSNVYPTVTGATVSITDTTDGISARLQES